jgi:hypothetical protein
MNIRGTRRSPVVPITAPTFAPSSSQASLYRKIAYTFLGLTVLIFLSVLFLSSVRATVDIRVKRSSVRTDGVVEIAKDAQSGQLPGRIVQMRIRRPPQEFEVRSMTETATTTPTFVASPTAGLPTTTTSTPTQQPASTATSVGTGIVRGQVTLVNDYSKAQTLVKTTRLLTPDGKLFRLEKTVTIPSAGRVTAMVYADKAGSDYAVGPTKFTIPGLWIDLQKFIYAESKTGFTAADGSSGVTNPPPTPAPTPAPSPTPAPTGTGEKRIVSQQNIDEAHKILFDQVVDQAKKTLAAEVSDARFNGVAYFMNTLDKPVSVRAGQAANTFTAAIEVEVTAVFYSTEDMQALIRSRLLEKLPEGQEFLPFNEQSFVYTLESADPKAEQARLRVIADGEYQLTARSPSLDKSVIAGKSQTDATNALKEVDGVEAVEIHLRPGWLGKVPSLKDHIEINLH